MPVDLSGPVYAEYKRARKRAEDAERRGALNDAAAAYRQSAELMRKYAQYGSDASMRRQRIQRAEALDKIAERMEELSTNVLHTPSAHPPAQTDTPSGDDDYEAEVLGLIQRTNVRWDDIGGLAETKAAIKSAYGMSLARKPKGIEIASWRNLLLFGPPGTGKTLLAAATAGSLDATFFNVKVSSLLSKYFGESTKLISALYVVARRLSPAVIFLDEFESLTPPRGSGESGAERRIVSTLLAELDGLETKDSQGFVLTIGATNVPWLLDAAILSRFQQRIYVPLPDPDTRQAILHLQIIRRGHKTQVPMEELIARSNGFSGREIEQLCQIALTHMTRRANPRLLEIVDRGQEAVRQYEIKVETLNQADFEAAFAQVRPVADREMLRKYDEWINNTAG